MSTLSTLQRRPPRPSFGARAAVLLLCVLAVVVVLLEIVRRSRETPVPSGRGAEAAAEAPGGATLAIEAAGAGRDAVPAGAADLERTEVDSARAPAPAAAVRPDVAVRGRVVGRGSPVAGAEIRLSMRHLDQRHPERKRSEIRCKPVATGSDGTFSFAGRAWRDVELLFEIHHERFAPALHRDVFHDVQSGHQLDVGDVPLVAGGSVEGSVADAHGNAVPAATVRLRPEDGPLQDHPDRWRLFPRIAVEANGGFRLDHVPAGAYRLDAEASQLEREYTDMFRVEEGESVALEPIRLSARFLLTGRVTDAVDAPIAGATVALLRMRGGEWREVQTDEDGWFRFDHLVDDTCSLRVDAEGYLRERRGGIVIRESPRVDVTVTKGLAIAVAVRELTTGQALDRFAARVRCVRSFEAVAETAARQQFQALVDGWAQRKVGFAGPGKRRLEHERDVEIRDAARRLREQGIDVDTRGRKRFVDDGAARRTAAAEDVLPADFAPAQPHEGGRCELSGLREGIYVVEVSAPRHQPWRSQGIELRRGVTPQVVVELERGLAIAGRVVDKATGEALRNTRVDLMVPRPPADTTAKSNAATALRARLLVGFDGKQFADTRTDDSGGFRFEQAPPGTYVVRARATGHARAWSEPLAVASDVEGLELRLGRSAAIHGRVEGLEPDGWRDACVVITDLRTDRTLAIREDSTYRAGDLPPGRYLVRAWRCRPEDGGRAMAKWLKRAGEPELRREDVELGEGAEVSFDVRIGPVEVATVTGSVLADRDGRPAHGCRIRLRELRDDAANAAAAAKPQRFDTSVDQHGSYELSSVVAGRYRLSVRVDDERGHDREVWHQEVVVYAGIDHVVPPIALTTAQLAGEPAPARPTGAKPGGTDPAPPGPPAAAPVPGAEGRPGPQGGGR
ncbi:MAG TPA: carboxypeptidase-like regulatory domain-containing protein [Planctomycetota bacterium]|nr:carboxypeptidase-like regulatory domain-containing protein [Planctomycetota bacterium]